MSRRRSSSGESISLFPFLSILACVIGTLTMMITAAALSQAGPPSAEDLAIQAAAEQRVRDFKALRERLAALEAERERLRAQVRALDAQSRDALARARAREAELARGRDLAARAQAARQEADRLRAELAALEQRVAALQKAIAALEEQIKVLKAELQKRADVPKEAVVRILPTGSGRNLKPLFVECAASGIVIHEGREPRRVAAADVTANADFHGALDRAKGRKDGTVVFLIRSDGVGTYQRAARVADERGVRHGKLPAPGQGVLDMSAYGG